MASKMSKCGLERMNETSNRGCELKGGWSIYSMASRKREGHEGGGTGGVVEIHAGK